ncbi:MAG: prolyl oligopeptidase family serine peptidase [Bacteroidota bacterium]|nr:prolyl oligopeptidase family serine peptidase [Bacteroidota bacterium]
MEKIVLDKKEVILNNLQSKMVISGWGEPAFSDTVLEKITYLSDSLKINGYVCYPKDNTNKKYPCVMWCRGGYGENGAIDEFTAKGIFGRIAAEGFVVFSTQYRGNDGSEGRDEAGGSDVNDILNLINAANEFPFADTKNWGIEGWSRGGMMAYLVLLRTNVFKCAVAAGAISDFEGYAKQNSQLKQIIAKYAGPENIDNEIKQRTIIDKVVQLPDIPFLLMHGGSDDVVSVNQTLSLAEEFTKFKRNYKLIIFDKGDHHIKNYKKEIEIQKIIWFNKYLKNGKLYES